MSGSQTALRNAAILILLVLICWQLLYWDVGDIALRSPAQTLSYVGTLLVGDMIWPHLWETMRAFVMALILAIVSGLTIGFTLGYSRSAAQTFEPILVAFYSIPKITLYPILLLIFGLGISAKVAFGTIHGIIPIALFTMNAVRNVRPVLIKTGKVMQLSQADMVRTILFPAALPEIFTGLRVGFSLTLIGTLLGEMFASQSGLGFLLMNAIGLHNIDLIMAITLILVVFAATVSSVLLFYDHKLHGQR
ncbi:NitT/TauT family transport system permease protein [Rhizobium sp. BK313]|jgi:NitT/TauT family transport system permease protein|uniref:ABC transporter permease n=1 Tax=Rhizobium sp. BK313 TaxID=2587081 RepID=UPI0010613811|nr:ABC transporter permease subunit [Rhizobium sp. BK313]MBB3454998.1 NitT/TauT family transport system permease protein [Rhizobium sp. BK313]